VRKPRHHAVTGPDPAPVRLEVELTVRLREAVEEVGALERQGTIDPAQLRRLREARHASAQERVIEELAIRQGEACMLRAEQTRKLAHGVTVRARLPARLHQLRPERQVCVSETI